MLLVKIKSKKEFEKLGYKEEGEYVVLNQNKVKIRFLNKITFCKLTHNKIDYRWPYRSDKLNYRFNKEQFQVLDSKLARILYDNNE